MKRLVLIGVMLLGFAIAIPQTAFAQSDPFLGVWQLNVAKSKYSPGQPPKSQTWYIRDEGNSRKNSQVTIRADGVPSALVFIHTYDDKPRPVPGAQGYDESANRCRLQGYWALFTSACYAPINCVPTILSNRLLYSAQDRKIVVKLTKQIIDGRGIGDTPSARMLSLIVLAMTPIRARRPPATSSGISSACG